MLLNTLLFGLSEQALNWLKLLHGWFKFTKLESLIGLCMIRLYLLLSIVETSLLLVHRDRVIV